MTGDIVHEEYGGELYGLCYLHGTLVAFTHKNTGCRLLANKLRPKFEVVENKVIKIRRFSDLSFAAFIQIHNLVNELVREETLIFLPESTFLP